MNDFNIKLADTCHNYKSAPNGELCANASGNSKTNARHPGLTSTPNRATSQEVNERLKIARIKLALWCIENEIAEYYKEKNRKALARRRKG